MINAGLLLPILQLTPQDLHFVFFLSEFFGCFSQSLLIGGGDLHICSKQSNIQADAIHNKRGHATIENDDNTTNTLPVNQ